MAERPWPERMSREAIEREIEAIPHDESREGGAQRARYLELAHELDRKEGIRG